ncbi:MAG: hypothetical protein ACHP7P_04220 [Terriglobales bacterium]
MKKLFLLLFAALLVAPAAGAQAMPSLPSTISAQSDSISTSTERRHHHRHRKHHHRAINAQ